MSPISAIFVLAAAILTIAGTVDASAKTFRTTVRISKAVVDPGVGTDLRGTVKSRKGLCRRGRKVDVYHDAPPPGPDKDDFFLGRGVTNKEGKWRVATTFEPDQVYAKVVRKKSGRTRCRSAVSKSIPTTF
jgi:hypothetical protein